MMNFRFEQSNGTGVLRLFDDITISDADELRDVLLMSLYNSDHLIVDCSGITELNCFVLNRIHTARNISSNLCKRLTLVNIRPEAMELISE